VTLISTEHLAMRYGSVTALSGLTFSVDPGIIGLVGANGAGKSTLIKILLGLLTPTSGSAYVLGLDAVHHGEEVRALVGYMPEHDCLPGDLSATDFVSHMGQMAGLPATTARERTAEVLRHVGLYEERYRAIGGYSTGMKQRVKLAQALVHDPRLLLLDEPTNGLDPAGRDDMLELVHRTGTQFGISVLVSSHLLGEIERICDHLVAIDGGRLLRSDSLASFTRARPVLTVEVDEGRDELAKALGQLGFVTKLDGRALLVTFAGAEDGNSAYIEDFDGVYDAVRDAVADLELPLVRLQQSRHRIEELFQTVPQQEAPLQHGAVHG
jgi:ABC-2 type transport system ATP-binding protein